MAGILWAIPLHFPAVQLRHSNTQAPYIALQHGVDRREYADLIGLFVTVGVIGEFYSDRIQAVALLLPSWLPCQDIYPHIALSWVDGAAAIEAGAMLRSGGYKSEVPDFDVLHCKIEWLE